MSRPLSRAVMAVSWALAASIHLTASVTTVEFPPLGIQPNIGQYDSEVLFAIGQTRFYGDRIRINSNLTIRFEVAVPLASVSGVEPSAVPLHSYLGSDPLRWRENVPHYSAIRYTRIYPGIDAEWYSGRGNPMVRVHVAAGSDAKQIRLQPEGILSGGWTVFPTSVIFWDVGSFWFDELVAYQPVGTSRLPVAVSWSQLDAQTFAPVIGNYDNTLPLIVDWGRGFDTESSYGTDLTPSADGSLALFGDNFLAGLSPDGKLRFVSMVGSFRARWLLADRDGSLVAVASTVPGSEATVTPGAPRSVPLADRGDGWIGRFDRNGRLLAATFTGGFVNATALGAAGDIYFATPESISKWSLGNSRFSFSVPIRNVTSLASDASGGLGFAASYLPGQPTTPGALKSKYENISDAYVGVLDRFSGATRVATYVPVYDVPFYAREASVSPNPTVAAAPNGTLWIASAIGVGSAVAHTLVLVSGDGRRVLRRETLPTVPRISFAQDNAWMALITATPSLPTSTDAPQRGACLAVGNLYLQRRTLDGVLTDATYLDTGDSLGAFRFLGFEGPSQILYTTFDRTRVVRVDGTVRRPDPGIACVVHTASRQSRSSGGAGAPGGLYTLVGNKLGPLAQVNAVWKADGNLPSSLAGVEVMLNDRPMPLVSVQQGLVTFYVPPDTPRGPARIALRAGGATVATTEMALTASVDFAILSADGSGVGLAAALNQDGTLNSPDNPAKWESVVSIFGTGPPQEQNPVSVSGFDTFIGGPVSYEYVGPAPGAVPGVTQVNLRLPRNVFNVPAGWLLIRPAFAGNFHPPMMIFVGP